jgi:hypothetical protein
VCFIFSYKSLFNKINSIYSIIGFSSLLLILLLPLFQISIFTGINSVRFLIFFEIYACIIIGVFCDNMIHRIRKIFKSNSKKLFINVFQSKGSPVLFAFLMFILFIELIPLYSGNLTFKNSFLNYYFDPENKPNPKAVDYSNWSPEDQELIDWITNNTDKSSRILLQNSGDEFGLIYSDGHTLGLIAQITDRYFANGDIDHFWYQNSINSTYTNDILYGKDISSYSWVEIKEYLYLYNIEYIIVWTPASYLTFYEFSIEYSDLKLIKSLEKFHIFQWKNAPRSYLHANDSNIQIVSAEMAPNKIDFIIQNISVPSQIIISLHNFKNWQVYLNGSKIEKISHSLDLIMFEIPSGLFHDVKIEIIWQKTPVESISNCISLIFLMLLIIYPIRKFRIKRLPIN